MRRIVLYALFILVALPCGCRQTELQEALPSIYDVTASVEENSVKLTARISGNCSGISSCGFRYGVSDEEMVLKKAELKDEVFSATLTEFKYDAKYVFQAFISNGYNYINSEIQEFKTPQRRAFTISESYLQVPWTGGSYVVILSESAGYEVVLPEEVQWVSLSRDKSRCTVDVAENSQKEPRSCKVIFRRLVDGRECELTISQEEIVYDLGLSSYESNLSSRASSFWVTVTGNADFEVLPPEDVSWVDVRVNGRKCIFSVEENKDTRPRECEIVVNSLDHDFVCFHKIVQQEMIYSLDLSSYESILSGDRHEIGLSVTANVDWEMSVPGSPDWIQTSVEGNDCIILVDANVSGNQRECEVVFTSPEHGLACAHHIVQAPSDKKCFNVELTHAWSSFAIYLATASNVGGEYADWLISWGEDQGYISFEAKENPSLKSRHILVELYTEKGDYLVDVTQHAYIENIDFDSPVTKEACVSLWDRNGDGELSYEEVVAISQVSKDCFAGHPMTSFDEFRFFINVLNWQSMPDYLFEGSSLESVSLPYGLWDHTSTGMFKDCRNLRKVDLGGRGVSAETFMNCISLEEIRAHVYGESAFEGCTSLKNVIYEWYGDVPARAFKGCCSLSIFTFEQLSAFSSSTIGKEAFYGCSSLPEMRLSRSLSVIEEKAFYGCSSLKAVYLASGVPPTIGTDAFEGTHPDLKFYVPEVLVNVYKSSWPHLADRIEACNWVE